MNSDDDEEISGSWVLWIIVCLVLLFGLAYLVVHLD